MTGAAFDLDGTLLKYNSSYAFCRYLCQKGFFARSELLFCTLIYLRHLYLGLSLWDLHEHVFSRLFRGVEVQRLCTFVDSFLDEKLNTLWYPPALSRLEHLQERGVECMIFSNSPIFLVSSLAKKIGVEKVFATEYHLNEKGELVSIKSLMDGFQKARLLKQNSSQNIIAFSDSHLDLPFLETAYCAVAVNPKRSLKCIAKKRGWEIL